jgi:hypothetical protein
VGLIGQLLGVIAEVFGVGFEAGGLAVEVGNSFSKFGSEFVAEHAETGANAVALCENTNPKNIIGRFALGIITVREDHSVSNGLSDPSVKEIYFPADGQDTHRENQDDDGRVNHRLRGR